MKRALMDDRVAPGSRTPPKRHQTLCSQNTAKHKYIEKNRFLSSFFSFLSFKKSPGAFLILFSFAFSSSFFRRLSNARCLLTRAVLSNHRVETKQENTVSALVDSLAARRLCRENHGAAIGIRTCSWLHVFRVSGDLPVCVGLTDSLYSGIRERVAYLNYSLPTLTLLPLFLLEKRRSEEKRTVVCSFTFRKSRCLHQLQICSSLENTVVKHTRIKVFGRIEQ